MSEEIPINESGEAGQEEIPFEPGDFNEFHKRQSDAAFLYVLFTFQFFVCTFGTYMFFRKLCGSKEYQKEKKVTALKLCIQIFLIVLNAFWMYHTWRLIELDHEMADKRFNPYAVLELVMPRLPSDGFNAPAVKRAYRNLAKKYHPDKIYLLSDAEQEEAPRKWLEI